MNTKTITPAYQQLLAMGMARWIPALMILLQRYEGIERALEPEEHPLHYIAARLEEIDGTHIAYRERMFLDAVTSMPLFYYRVVANREFWNPREEIFQQFECRVNAVMIWQDWTPMYSAQDVKHWLYTNLQVSHHARATA